MRTAYLVAHLDTTTSPPQVCRAGIYAEPAAQLEGAVQTRRLAVELIKVEADTFESAKTAILDTLDSPDGKPYAWVLNFLSDKDRERSAQPRTEYVPVIALRQVDRARRFLIQTGADLRLRIPELGDKYNEALKPVLDSIDAVGKVLAGRLPPIPSQGIKVRHRDPSS